MASRKHTDSGDILGGPRRSWDRLGSVLFFVLSFGIAFLVVLGSFWGRFGALRGSFWCFFGSSTHRFNPSTHQLVDSNHQLINSSTYSITVLQYCSIAIFKRVRGGRGITATAQPRSAVCSWRTLLIVIITTTKIIIIIIIITITIIKAR